MFVTLVAALAVLGAPKLPSVARRATADEQQFYASVASELMAGASLRTAVADSARPHDDSVMARVGAAARSGASLDAVADILSELPVNGMAAAAAIRVADRAGAAAAPVFARLADRTAARAEVERQRRTLTTQARLSAAVVGALPLMWLAFGGIGRIAALIQQGGAPVAALGLTMETVGVALIWRLAS